MTNKIKYIYIHVSIYIFENPQSFHLKYVNLSNKRTSLPLLQKRKLFELMNVRDSKNLRGYEIEKAILLSLNCVINMHVAYMYSLKEGENPYNN